MCHKGILVPLGCFKHEFIPQYFLSTYYVLLTVLGTGDTAVNQRQKVDKVSELCRQ